MPWVSGPTCPHPEGEGQATAVQCPACSLPGMGARAPRQSRGWTSICQELGRWRGSTWGSMHAPFSPPAPSDAASRHRMCPLRTHSSVPWDGEPSSGTLLQQPPLPSGPGMAQATTAPSPSWSPPPIFMHHLPPAFLPLLPATGEDEEE